jgi:hypothetical protein
VLVAVQVDSLRATSLIHAGRFTKPSNATSTTSTTTNTPLAAANETSKDHLREILEELPDDDSVS